MSLWKRKTDRELVDAIRQSERHRTLGAVISMVVGLGLLALHLWAHFAVQKKAQQVLEAFASTGSPITGQQVNGLGYAMGLAEGRKEMLGLALGAVFFFRGLRSLAAGRPARLLIQLFDRTAGDDGGRA